MAHLKDVVGVLDDEGDAETTDGVIDDHDPNGGVETVVNRFRKPRHRIFVEALAGDGENADEDGEGGELDILHPPFWKGKNIVVFTSG